MEKILSMLQNPKLKGVINMKKSVLYSTDNGIHTESFVLRENGQIPSNVEPYITHDRVTVKSSKDLILDSHQRNQTCPD